MIRSMVFFLSLFAFGGSLGVQVYELPPDVRAQSAIYNLQGVVVGQIVAGGAAAKSGLRVNDIITEVAAEPVTSVRGLLAILARHGSGENVLVGVVRPGNKLPWPTIALHVKLGAGGSVDPEPVSPDTRINPKRVVTGPVRGITAAGALPVTAKQRGHCQAMLPADWEIVDSRDAGDAVDVMPNDKRSYAGWLIRGVNSAMRSYYGDVYGDPAASSRATVSMIGKSAFGDEGPFQYTGQAMQIGAGFIAQQLSSGAHRAEIIYRVYPPPPMSAQGSYIISLRVAMAPISGGDRALSTAVGVAMATQCNTQFIPPKNGDIALPRPGDAFDRRRKSETNDLTDYNVQTGSQYAHSPSTGQTYLLDRAAQWNDHGPDGPGYYRPVGNSYEKLVPGIQ